MQTRTTAAVAIPRPPPLRAPREILVLAGGLWLAAWVLMVAFSAADSAGLLLEEAARLFLLALLGASLCGLLWLALEFSSRRPLMERMVLLGVGLLSAAALTVAADLASAQLLREAFGSTGPTRMVIASNPLRAASMRLAADTNLVLYAGLYGFFGAAATAVLSATESRERDRQLSEAKAATSRAQLAALRLQLNPHFLFNTLNALGSLVVTQRTQEAEAMIGKLSDFLRSALSFEAEPFIPLEDELATIESYLEIEAVRFRDRLIVRYDCPPALRSALTPSFLLQPLVENAIKYAVSPALRPVTLTVSARQEANTLVLAIEDDGAGVPPQRGHGAGVGLRNVRERLALLYEAEASLEAGRRAQGYAAIVRLPLRLGRGAQAA